MVTFATFDPEGEEEIEYSPKYGHVSKVTKPSVEIDEATGLDKDWIFYDFLQERGQERKYLFIHAKTGVEMEVGWNDLFKDRPQDFVKIKVNVDADMMLFMDGDPSREKAEELVQSFMSPSNLPIGWRCEWMLPHEARELFKALNVKCASNEVPEEFDIVCFEVL